MRRTHLKDEKIVKLMCQRNEKGLIRLMEKYEKLMYYIISGILGDRQSDIDECLNDTFFKLWKHADRIDLKKAGLKTYSKTVARNTAINRLRDLSRKESFIIDADGDTLLADYVDRYQNIENRIILQEDVKNLERVIMNLKDEDRELMLRRYFYLQKSKDIAAAMNMSVTAVNSRLSRLKIKIRKNYESSDNNSE